MKKVIYLIILINMNSCSKPEPLPEKLDSELNITGLTDISINKISKYFIEADLKYEITNKKDKINFNSKEVKSVRKINLAIPFEEKELKKLEANNDFLEKDHFSTAFGRMASPPIEERFTKIFKNNDDKLSALEVRKYLIIKEDEFKKFDLDKDNFINKGELASFLQTIRNY
jgi:hypothetical protein